MNMIHLSLSLESQSTLAKIMRAAGLNSQDASEDHSFPLMVVSPAQLDEVLATLNDPVSARIQSFGILPADEGLFLYMDLDGEVEHLAKEAGADGVKMLIGRCHRNTEVLDSFVGASLSFDELRVTSEGEEPYIKNLNTEDADND
jgi:hypothetical protein